ncbi:iron complex transport system ATP-binding protein [Caldalkalibacillus uzonensis]|uniref:Iron complex transport system ATP-binding protein n=1 Tax=Caldalkalibacillus uzonensis TaxID=353224 RepID=A0ABU0CSY1_9BACI|nr:ABC transporter ATP-binding protein [Caldalkalibacillus uzonensis]MDQ0339536.1 iron complex transport system ATP-binding protein [Caldalkalibacillus uzonensis]
MRPEQIVIDVQQVYWRRNGRTILDNILWQVKKGEHWAIVGLNGSGKTSLLNLICAYEWPSQGEIHVLGRRLGKVDINRLRQSIGWVSPALAERYRAYDHMPAEDIVLSGKFASIGLWQQVELDDVEQARYYLSLFQVEHKARQPFGSLSSGEQQKVLLARAWMAEPALIILDEPCSGLDLRAREGLLSSLDQLAAKENGPTLLYVTHHIEEIMPCFSHVLLLKEGRVVAAGEKEEVLTPPLLAETFDLAVDVAWKQGRAWISVNASI